MFLFTLNQIIWNANPEIFRFGDFAIRWYGLLFAVAFYFSYLVMLRFFKHENIKTDLLDKLTMYIFFGTLIGARLGHCLLYEPKYYFSNPLEIIKVWHGGLASHGAAIGIIIAIFIFSFRNKINFLWTIDRIVIVVALAGMFIRTGNLMNSEIFGFPTNNKYGFVFTRNITDDIKYSNSSIISVKYKKNLVITKQNNERIPLTMQIKFDKQQITNSQVEQYINKQLVSILVNHSLSNEPTIYLPLNEPFDYKINQEPKYITASVALYGIARHPTQIYEAISYLIIFLLLMFLYFKSNCSYKRGLIFGIFLVTLFGMRFIIEFLKEAQVNSEKNFILNYGQLFSIPFIIAGIIFIAINLKKNSINSL